ncbi:hypothetical protein [Spongiactinospora sp. TRM90649]|uniref:hypothetical protein n=1 Tax=Spongiactinospora sp. TRM90649 TaxID=3031114 RepID=UPI0023F80851|nr:hypothetical protein [Spongiactinospora sp. TRM90649]MDF5752937.1 hypothetical protein [Spongiactinospora sp. TRM90649]
MASIGYFEAWGIWWEGKSTLGHDLFGVMSMVWVGRIGKVLSFVGGLTILLDIVGAERLKRLAPVIKNAGALLVLSAIGSAFFLIPAVSEHVFILVDLVERMPDIPVLSVLLFVVAFLVTMIFAVFGPILLFYAPGLLLMWLQEQVARLLAHERNVTIMRIGAFACIVVRWRGE